MPGSVGAGALPTAHLFVLHDVSCHTYHTDTCDLVRTGMNICHAWHITLCLSQGQVVGFCGDGANDCGALKAAHVGVSLCEAEVRTHS